jgi:hypothetical protein
MRESFDAVSDASHRLHRDLADWHYKVQHDGTLNDVIELEKATPVIERAMREGIELGAKLEKAMELLKASMEKVQQHEASIRDMQRRGLPVDESEPPNVPDNVF